MGIWAVVDKYMAKKQEGDDDRVKRSRLWFWAVDGGMGVVVREYSVSDFRFLPYIVLIPKDEKLLNGFGMALNTQ